MAEEEEDNNNEKQNKTYMLYYLQERCLKTLAEKFTIQNISRFLQKYRHLRYKHNLIDYTCNSISSRQICNAPKKIKRSILITKEMNVETQAEAASGGNL